MRGAIGTSVACAISVALGVATLLSPSACTWSSTCTDGKITTESLPDATVSQEYSFRLTQSCGSSDGASWQLGNQAPPGIALSWDGRLFGTPTTAGRFSLQVSVPLTSRGSGGVEYQVGSDSRNYTLTVRP